MFTSRNAVLVLAVAALIVWVDGHRPPAWLVIVAAVAALGFGTQARIRQNRLERRFARRIWSSFR